MPASLLPEALLRPDGPIAATDRELAAVFAGWPLGPTQAHARVEMTNLLGDEIERWTDLNGENDARLHLYGKAQARPGRKMGHVNRVLGPI